MRLDLGGRRESFWRRQIPESVSVECGRYELGRRAGWEIKPNKNARLRWGRPCTVAWGAADESNCQLNE